MLIKDKLLAQNLSSVIAGALLQNLGAHRSGRGQRPTCFHKGDPCPSSHRQRAPKLQYALNQQSLEAVLDASDGAEDLLGATNTLVGFGECQHSGLGCTDLSCSWWTGMCSQGVQVDMGRSGFEICLQI